MAELAIASRFCTTFHGISRAGNSQLLRANVGLDKHCHLYNCNKQVWNSGLKGSIQSIVLALESKP